MRRTLLAAMLVATVLPLQACAGPGHDVRVNSAFASNPTTYRTYSWVDTRMRAPSGMDSVTYQRLQSNIDGALGQKGYQRGDPGDLTLVLTIGARDYSDTSWYYGDYRYTEGQLSVDVFDTKSKQALWHGQAIGSVDRTNPDPEKVDAALTEIMDQFPAAAPPQ